MFGSVFGRVSAKPCPKNHLERWGSSCSASCTKNQPRRPNPRPLRGTKQIRPDCLQVHTSSTVAHTSLIQINIFLHARTPQSRDSTIAVPGGRLWHAAGHLTVHARSTVTLTSPTAPRACHPARLRDRGRLAERSEAQHGPNQTAPAIALPRSVIESPRSTSAKPKWSTKHELSNPR